MAKLLERPLGSIKLLKIQTTLNIMFWICSLILREQGYMLDIPLGYIAFRNIYSRYKRLKGFNVLHPMGFGTVLDFRQNNTPFKQVDIPAITTKNNIAVTVINSTKSDRVMIGTEKSEPAIPIITTGHNGLSLKCFIIIMITICRKRSLSADLFRKISKKKALKICMHFHP